MSQAENQFEITADGERMGVARFVEEPGRRIFFHTEVSPDHEGEGMGGQLVSEALDATRQAGLRVVPVCSYVQGYIERHDEYADLVDQEGGAG